MNRQNWLILTICVTLVPLNGCGKADPIDGTYHDSSGIMTFHFHAGHCDVGAAGQSVGYTVEHAGNTVTIRPEVGRNAMVFKIQADGSMINQETGNKIAR